MENIVRVIMNLVACEVCGKEIDRTQYELSREELEKLYELSKSHDLAHIVGDALIKNGLIQNNELKAKFQKQVMLAVYRYEKLQYELTRLKDVLNEAKIPFIPLKGSVIRKFYPEPWLRTSCDIDVLVKENSVDNALDVLMKKFGGKDVKRTRHDISFMTSDSVHIELHHSLIEEGRIGTAEKLLENIWDYAKPINDTFEYELSRGMFYYYHLAHMAKHIEGGGCGIRPFLDLHLLNSNGFGDAECAGLLKAGGLDAFASAANRLSAYWFGNGNADELSQRLEKYIVYSGVYGNNENHSAVKQIQKKSKLKYILSRLWIPYKDLILLYPSLENRKFLLSAYEFRRWLRLTDHSMLKRKKKELKTITSISEKKIRETDKMLSDLGLIK